MRIVVLYIGYRLSKNSRIYIENSIIVCTIITAPINLLFAMILIVLVTAAVVVIVVVVVVVIVVLVIVVVSMFNIFFSNRILIFTYMS